jgi:tellurite resistance protein TerB
VGPHQGVRIDDADPVGGEEERPQERRVLQNFPAEDLRRRFEENLNRLTTDFDFGKVSVMQEIAKAKKKPAEARAVIQIGIVIGGADGDFDKDEQAVVREACYALDLPPHEFDL